MKRLWKKFCQLWSQGTRWHQTSTACVDASTRTCSWFQRSLMSPAETRPAIGTPSLAIQSFPHLRKVAFMSCFPDCFFYITCQVWESLWDRANSSLGHQQCGPPDSSWPWIWDVYRVAQTRCVLFFYLSIRENLMSVDLLCHALNLILEIHFFDVLNVWDDVQCQKIYY